jgi:ribosomal subunit interface protein
MHKRITFRNMEHSEILKEYADKKLEKIVRFLGTERMPIYINLVFEPSKVHEHHRVELRVKAEHYDLISNYEFKGEPFYDVLDRVIDVMYNKLHERKQYMKKDRVKTCGRKGKFKKQR